MTRGTPVAGVEGRTEAREGAGAARLDRELNELLQELRVAQNGILLLVAFLLVIPFSTRFSDVTDFQRIVYYVTFVTAGAAAVTIIAPVSYHRLVFRRRDKEALIVRGNFLMILGMAQLALAILGVLVLITDFLFSRTLVFVMGALYIGAVALLWYGLPLYSRSRPRRGGL